MKAIAQSGPGGPDNLSMMTLATPEPGFGEIRVEVHAASLNPVDYKVMAGGHPAWTYPHVPGVDASGIVHAVGEGAQGWSIGDRVVFHADFTKQGVCAEYALTTAHTAAKLPESVSFEEAAAFPCAGLTAYQAIVRKMRAQAGQSILIHGGAGGVGGYAIQIAKALGLGPIYTTASSENADYVMAIGADVVIDYQAEHVLSRILELTDGRGVDLILNTVNRLTSQDDLSVLSFGGQLACIAGAPETVADFQPSSKTFTLHKLMLGGAHGSGNRQAEEDIARMTEEFLAWITDGQIRPLQQKLIKLEEVPDELRRLSGRHVRGKIVVQVRG
ncbi:zinc-binding dehydrogenase [Paenibacillus soyae]|uniref:Zinc-binding dehydrogenase n=1 Tax=Paenibacillus soyae TaxID=2969249 RepID=A0A9X2MLH0_9BACL|nr:zinc-binding dehydrogenase [Paenibacillus soyae]MCR2802826.1 zinc-binding dehydrogenase [Paenibacillus soyae]